MTNAIPTQPLTAAAFLFGDTKEDSVDALAHALHEQGVLGTLGEGVTKLSRAGRNAANDQIATVAPAVARPEGSAGPRCARAVQRAQPPRATRAASTPKQPRSPLRN